MTTTVFSSSVISRGTAPIFTYAESGDRLIVNAGVTLSTQGDYAVHADYLSSLHATINGTLFAPGEAALYADGSSIELTVGSRGRLETSNGLAAFQASYDSSVANHGVIRGETGYGIVLTSTTTGLVENWGVIYGRQGALNYQTSQNATIVNHGIMETRWTSALYSDAGTTHLANDGFIRATGESAWAMQVAGSIFNPDATTATIDNSGSIASSLDVAFFAAGASMNIVNEGTISGATGSLTFIFSGADTIRNDGLLDGRAMLGAGDDVYHGEAGRVSGAVWGQAGDDLLVGGVWADILGGGSGDDTITGGAGADALTGSTGADCISGGSGDDVFRFATAGESIGDRIVCSGGVPAFERAGIDGGDQIDVSAIDANASLPGFQHFVFGTSHGVGRLWAVDVGNVTHIRGNTTGTAAPEFDLAIHDGAGVHASDYPSIDFIL